MRLARSFLKRDGAIFVSCDENEHTRLKALMDEIFGQENFVADMVWAAGRKNDSRLISVSHEYIVCYAKDIQHLKELKVEWRQRKKGLDDIYRQYKKLKNAYGDDHGTISSGLKEWFKNLADSHPAKTHKHYSHVDCRGIYFPADISWTGGGGPRYEVLHPVTQKPVKVPSRGWMTSDPQKMQEWIEDERVHFGADENSVPCIKSYLKDREFQAPYSVFYQDGRAATKRLRTLMGGDFFNFPKDETVIQELIEMLTGEDDYVMDFFAGSGTTAHAVMLQNQNDKASRRFILVQLPEPLDNENKQQKAAAEFCDALGVTRTIAELAKERIKRSARLLKHKDSMDLGFKVFKLNSSNIRQWNPDTNDLESTLLSHSEHITEGRTEYDILYELLLKRGVDLAVPIEMRNFSGKTIYSIGYGVLFACFDEEFTKEQVELVGQCIVDWYQELASNSDSYVFFRDSAFSDDISKTNMAAILEQNGITHVHCL